MNPKVSWAKDWLSNEKLNYIDGKWTKGTSERKFSCVNPTNKEELGCFSIASQANVENAAKSAHNARDSWRRISRRERAQLLQKLGQVIRDHHDELATLETLQNGKTYVESFDDDIPESADVFDYYAGWIDKYYGENCPVADGVINFTTREPVGVCGLIVPWNFPLLLACWKLAPALAMGNSVVIKPSEYTPFTLVRLFELIHTKLDFPKGVLNLVLGDQETGSAITASPAIDKVSFTGSSKVGGAILQAAGASNLKRVTLELGGKSPNIIFDDVPDLGAAIDRSFAAMFSHKGEKCSEPTRLIVHKDHYEKCLEKLAQKAEAVRCGDPFEKGTGQGAQCNAQQYKKILEYIDIGKQEKLRLVAGGKADAVGGFFIRPTIFADVPAKSRLFQEEIFGPVLTVTPFTSEAEAVQLANDTRYGLAAGLWSKDISRAHRVASALDAGMVFINRYGMYDFCSPFGGVKQSGWGKEMGVHSLDAYTRLKSVWVKL